MNEPRESRPGRLRCLLVPPWGVLAFVGAVVFGIFGYYLYCVNSVYVSAPAQGAPPASRYFGFGNIEGYFAGLGQKDVRPKNVCVVRGRFFGNGPDLQATLYSVESGRVTEINSLSVGESSSRIGGELGERLAITVALGEVNTPVGRVTLLGSAGHTAGAGSGGPIANSVVGNWHMVLDGRVPRASARMVYVEGDEPANVSRSMSVDEFAQQNPGNYLVVTMQLK